MQTQWGTVDYLKSLTVTTRRQARSNGIWSCQSPSLWKLFSYFRTYFLKVNSCGSPSFRAGVFGRWFCQNLPTYWSCCNTERFCDALRKAGL